MLPELRNFRAYRRQQYLSGLHFALQYLLYASHELHRLSEFWICSLFIRESMPEPMPGWVLREQHYLFLFDVYFSLRTLQQYQRA